MKLVTVLVNRDCGHCLRAVEQVERLAMETGASVAAMDITAHPETAARLQLKSSPAVLFENGVAYAGVPTGDQFDHLAYAPAA